MHYSETSLETMMSPWTIFPGKDTRFEYCIFCCNDRVIRAAFRGTRWHRVDNGKHKTLRMHRTGR